MKMLNGCEHYEGHVSAWLDGELEHAGQVELLDHIVRCAQCRNFYVEARALDGLVALVREPATKPAASPEIWTRIAAATGAERREPRRKGGFPTWAMQVAAALVIAVGLGVAYWSGGAGEIAEPEASTVRIGEDSGQMTDARFVELTKEVLRSDERYRTAMLSVMQQVVRGRDAMEASVEEYVREPENDVDAEVENSSRMPA